MLVYPSATDLSTAHLRYLSRELAARRREIGSRQPLAPGRQALLALAHLQCRDTYAQLATGFRIGIATVYHYVHEAVKVLAALAPTPAEAMVTAGTKAYMIVDGTVLPIDRIAADRPYYSGKKRHHGMNVQVLTDPFGRLLWASPALPGATHDLTAAREHGIIDALADVDLKAYADKTPHAVMGSSSCCERGRLRTGEGDCFIESLAVGQAVVELSEHAVEQMAEGSVVAVAGVASPDVVGVSPG